MESASRNFALNLFHEINPCSYYILRLQLWNTAYLTTKGSIQNSSKSGHFIFIYLHNWKGQFSKGISYMKTKDRERVKIACIKQK